MRLPLDAHAFIWWDSDPARLSAVALAALRDPANSVWLSVVSAWEVLIKAQLGKLSVHVPLPDIVALQQRIASSPRIPSGCCGNRNRDERNARRVLSNE